MYEADFERHLRSEGYEPVKPIQADTATWPRLKFEGERHSSGGYKFQYTDGGHAFASYGSNKDPLGWRVWKSYKDSELSDDEQKKLKKEIKRIRKEQEEQAEKEYYAVSREMNAMYKGLPKAEADHPYLVNKAISEPVMARVSDDGALVLPVIQPDNRVWSVQYVTENSKLFHPGGKVKGGFCPLSKSDEDWSVIYICEGYATGCTIREATGAAVVVAFNAGNLTLVAEEFRKRYPESSIIIAADNDQFPSDNWPDNRKWVNTGIEKGTQAAHAVKGQCLQPEFDEEYFDERPTDWNDFAGIYGIDEVKGALAAVKPAGPDLKNTSLTNPLHLPMTYQHDSYNEDNWITKVRWKNKDEGFMDLEHSLHNAILFLTYNHVFKGTFIYDEFDHEPKVIKALPWDTEKFEWRSIEETDLTQLKALLKTQRMRIGSNTEMKQVLDVVCKNATQHPVRLYFDNLEWDGRPRLDTWLRDYCDAKAESNDYLAAVGACMFKASVKRIYNPGEKFDHMLVLEGKQAAGKSTLLKEIATFNGVSYFSDHVGFSHIGDKHLASHLQGKLILEFAELDGLSTKDRNKIKSWITKTDDEVMPKYSNEIKTFKRQFILTGSTNDSSWMTDPTGNRRFWPVKVGDIDVKGVADVKEQLWAEAVHRVKAGELHYIETDDPVYKHAELEQAGRLSGHVWQETIEDYIAGLDRVTVNEILNDCLFITKDRWSNRHKAEVGDIMRGFGWEYKPARDTDGKVRRMWVRKEKEDVQR